MSTIKESIQNIRDVADSMQISGVRNAKSIVYIVDTCTAILQAIEDQSKSNTEKDDDSVKME